MHSDLVLVVSAQVLVIGAVAAAIGVLLLRHLVCRRRVRARGRAVLVTGCDRGVGLELAAHLDALGFRVLAGVREPCGAGAARLQARTSVLTRLVDLDVTSADSVTAAFTQVHRELQQTDTELWAVINNAGVCIPGELQWLTWEQCQRSLQVNLEGAVRVTKAFLPLLQQAKGRVVFVTSCFADGGLPGVGLLSATSAALDALADCLRLEAQGQVKVSTVQLGDFSLTTGLLSEHHREVAAMRAALPAAAEVDRFSAYQDAVASRGLTLRSAAMPQPLPKTVCAAFEDALLTRRPLRAYRVSEGAGARLGRWLRAQLPSDLRDAIVMRRFRRQLPKVTHL